MSNERKPNIIVLMDDETRQSPFLKNLGKTQYQSYLSTLCRMPTPAEYQITIAFYFEIFGLLTQDPKLDKFISNNDGLIILLELTKLDNSVFERIKNIINNSSNLPILFVIEKYLVFEIPVDTLLKFQEFTKVDYRKCFLVDYTNEKYNASIPKNWFNEIIKKIVPKNKNQIITSANMPIKEFVTKFKNNELNINLWDHYGRLRIVYYAIRRYGYDDCINQYGWLCENWKKYKNSIGHGKLWHYTLTRFWVNIINDILLVYDYPSFSELYKHHPEIHNGKLFEKYYSHDVLFSEKARNSWIPPNLTDLSIICNNSI